jgi:hypothetical protein
MGALGVAASRVQGFFQSCESTHTCVHRACDGY